MPFSYTTQGYLAALDYLVETKQLNKQDEELSLDGYTLVALANYLEEQDGDT